MTAATISAIATSTISIPLASAATTTASTTTTTEVAPRWTLFFGPGFDDFHRAAIDGLIVNGVDRGKRLGFDGHFHETKSTGTTRLTIIDDAGAGDGAMLLKYRAKIVVAHLEGEVADVEVHRE